MNCKDNQTFSKQLDRFIAHRSEKYDKSQDLWAHLKETSFWAFKFASKIGLGQHGQLAGLIHDIGKATAEFDQYIRSATGLIEPDEDEYVDAIGKKGKIDHSSAGAQVIYRHFSNRDQKFLFVLQILSLIISSHHSGLIDCLTTDGEDNYTRRMIKTDEKTRTSEALSNLNDDIRHQIMELLSNDDLVDQMNKKIISLRENNDLVDSYMFKISLLTRFLFSCLIDADRLNTADFEFPEGAELRNQGEYVAWPVLIDRLNLYLSKFENKNDVDAIRGNISNYCLDFSNRPKGLFQLTVPTGGGKTLASLRFALNHACKHKMERIIYIIPYTSIIDQNADVTRNILEDRTENGVYLDRIVLEHHSNLTPEKESTRQKILSENWDAPVVFATMVQFLEALFGYGARNARRMHQLANAVLIFDEIQALPVRCVHLFNLAIRFLIGGCGSTVVLCTATQPLLDQVKPEQRALQINPDQQMIPDVQTLFKELKRVKVFDRRKLRGWTDDDVAALVEQELQETGSVLIVVNTKKSAINLFQLLSQHASTEVKHLSTNMCPAHRMEVLDRIKECLPDKKPVICVSTQLIEAGVDIDFGTVIRYLAGLDSIAQSAGRCNRNGARPEPGRVIIINPQGENLDYLNDIKVGRDVAERVLDEFNTDAKQFEGDILGLKAMERYYQYYFYARKEEMCYKVGSNSVVGRSDNLFELLSTNLQSVYGYQRNNDSSPKIPLRQSFMTAAKAFQAIDSPARGVIVQYGEEGERIVNELCAAVDLEKQYRLLKQAQRYSINIYPYVFDQMTRQKVINEVQKGAGVFYLNKQFYDKDCGFSGGITNEMEFLIY
ncbi:CRISPR-associated nuclease/helicase Cas3 [Pelotomaculum sp. FP]|uniref:CRISPR-associated helicase Cas3' n=1 Tax=Pelotomaculum sp. FP TaxID=261474 RepID=UPI001066DEF8|nr:CRISPR-associated helicase Cas3' [Pelotomaculum sp. FP]TEB12456.1 CRISPR-associated nuclease/helicase Cas3 [Pelotomaculum sp. FP]